jgi:ubiquinone/menaquinone biosynthesis C-methylase UbiE
MGMPWYLDELAHAGPEHLDPEYVASYERKAGVDAHDEVARLRALGLGSDSTLVDLGAGTGAIAFAAAPWCRRVVAVDVSPAMVEAMRRKRADNVEVVHAGLLSYAHQGRPADVVFARHCLHQVPDFWKAIALRRIAGVLRVGGVLVVRDLFLSCDIDEVPEVIAGWLDNAADDPRAGWTRAELETHLRDEYSTFTWLFEPMLLRAGFEISETAYAESRTYARYTCVRVS